MNYIDISEVHDALRDHRIFVTSVDVRNPCDPISKITIEGLLYVTNEALIFARGKHDRARIMPKRIFKNGLYTTVMWSDGTKTIVKRGEDEPDDEYTAFTAALAKKLYGSTSAVKRIAEMTKVQSKKYKEPVEKKNALGLTKEEVQKAVDEIKEEGGIAAYIFKHSNNTEKYSKDESLATGLNDLAREQWEEYLNSKKE